ncbi:hypothetical protein GQ53DRAFT_50078 [Thozetella sp. PMI_491]|nr:hypothetical protein GQ53DRAFT_50078 [Thozetella sp. PMI_491]
MARTRTRHSDHCALCGVRLNRGLFGPGPSPVPWVSNIRAVCFVNTRARPFLTGVGYLANHVAIADDDASVSYTDPGAVLTHHRLTPDDIRSENVRLAFGVHDACWTLLLSRIIPAAPDQEPDRDEIEAVVAHLYNVFFSLYQGRHKMLNPGRDFGGAWRFYIQSPRLLEAHSLLTFSITTTSTDHDGELTEEWSFLFADPRQASIGDAPPQALPDIQGFIRDSSDIGDFFVRIPREIAMAVLAELPSADLCSLRLASRRVASLSSPTSLPNSFWRSRFDHGFEMAFYMPESVPEPSSRDWRRLYGQIQYCLARPTKYEALCNRQRIWHVLGDLSTTLKALLKGSPATETSINYAALKPLRPGMVARVPRPAHQNPASPSASFTFAWDSEDAFSSSSINISAPIKISTSFINFDRRTFVCGIRATAATPAATISQVGLISWATEQHFYLEKGQEITKVRVICSALGVVGMKFFIQTTGREHAESETWESVGTTSIVDGELGVAELKTSGKILGLTLEFDACKCISVGILGPCDGLADESTAASPLWSPDIPENFQFTSQASVQDPGEEESKYCLNIDFGGPHGERLALLNRVTPFLDGADYLRGMAFYYDDGTELVFGSRLAFGKGDVCKACLEPSLPIRGSAGERIIRIYCRGMTPSNDPRSTPHFQVWHPSLLKKLPLIHDPKLTYLAVD